MAFHLTSRVADNLICMNLLQPTLPTSNSMSNGFCGNKLRVAGVAPEFHLLRGHPHYSYENATQGPLCHVLHFIFPSGAPLTIIKIKMGERKKKSVVRGGPIKR